MPLNTIQSVSPYFDDYDESKNFYKTLFKPGVSVQVRELNQLQTQFQKQIERFGDNIFKRGTIIDGCQFIFHNVFPYIKLSDTDTDNNSFVVDDMLHKIVKNETGLKAYVVKTTSGYEAADPDLNTLYVRYLNSGNSTTDTSYIGGDTLTIYDADYTLQTVKITSGSSLLSNSDNLVFLSALEIQNTSGGTTLPTSFSAGERITQATTGAQANVISVNSTANASALTILIKPFANNLANGSNTAAWSFSTGYTITGAASGATANVVGKVGSGAVGGIITDGSGIVTNASITTSGNGYYIAPYVSVSSTNNTGNTAALALVDMEARNYSLRVAVPTISGANGIGYGFSVTEGIVYQKGFFSKVDQQLIVVEKYSNAPHEKVIGFNTIESVVNSSVDSSLLDNATGRSNESAPGADRLKLEPVLVALAKTDASANDDFFSLVEFSSGKPFKQETATVYNVIGDEIARRTFEESGNYVLDPFLLSTRSSSTISADSNTFSMIIDPGLAYINGYRVQTLTNYVTPIRKGVDTKIVAGNAVDLDYGNYIRVKELGGTFRTNFGAQISLRGTANSYLTSYAGSTISTGPGTEIGTARMRSLILDNGTPGTANATYKLFLFDVRMNSGKNFKNVRSVFYDGTNKGVADIVQTYDATTATSFSIIEDVETAKLIFPTKTPATKTLLSNGSSANLVYTARLVSNSASISAAGAGGNLNQQITISNTGSGWFPYSGSLSSTEKADIVVIPQSNSQASANAAGSVATTTGQTNVTGTSTTFTTVFKSGDWIKVANSTALEIRQVLSVVNNTLITCANAFTNTFASSNSIVYFPQNVPIPIANRTDRTATVAANTTLYIGLGVALNVSPTATVLYNQKVSVSPSAVSKTAKRKIYVKIRANTNIANTVGPWCLGLPDAFRLRNVYYAEATTVNTNSTNITNEFFVDHNQNEDFYDVAYLYKKPTSTYTISANAVLLAEIDVFTKTANGVTTVDSYPINNTLALANADLTPLNSTINVTELPEIYGSRGNYYDTRDALDFRLYSANTANVATTAATATTNPVEPTAAARFDSTTEKFFPLPESDASFDVEYYLGRVDRVILNSDGSFRVIAGVPGENTTAPRAIEDSITINIINVPPFPSVPASLTANSILLYDTKIANERYSSKRLKTYAINMPIANSDSTYKQPKRYNMNDIGSLERRINDLEYYVQLSMIESTVRDQVIPSSGNSAIQRFKFGFFVDNFETTQFSDLANPAYNATVLNGQLTAKKKQINLPFVPEPNNANNASLTLPYAEYSLVKQLSATDGSVVIANTSSNAVSNTSTNTVVQSMVCVNILNSTDSYTSNGTTHEVSEFYMSGNTGTATVYFDVFTAVDRLEVYQNTSPNFDYTVMTPYVTSESATNLTSDERTTLESARIFADSSDRKGAWSTANRPDFALSAGPGGSTYWVKDAGKLSWTHAPASGRYYKIVVKKGSSSFSYRFCYPSDSNSVISTVTNPPPVLNYTGRFTKKQPDSFILKYAISNLNLNLYTYNTGPLGGFTGVGPGRFSS